MSDYVEVVSRRPELIGLCERRDSFREEGDIAKQRREFEHDRRRDNEGGQGDGLERRRQLSGRS